jgi:NTP pyrophosphatase (non-canonical NTP hydrolase)
MAKSSSNSAAPLTLADFQQHVRDRYFAADSARGWAPTFAYLIEEVGELATALSNDDPDNLREEMADVLAWLCTLANIRGVDLTAAVRDKYFGATPPKGTK